jgi:hypothetical protein
MACGVLGLRQVGRDPALARKFARQKSFDTVLAGGMKSFAVPSDLKASILASRKVVKLPVWRDWRARAALAASIVIFAALAGALFNRGPARFAEFRTQLIGQAWASDSHLDYESSDWKQVKRWLAQRNVEANFTLPPALAELQVHGCKMVEVDGRNVPFVCLADGPKHLHLFVVDNINLRDFPSAGVPDFEKCGAWKTASWQQDGKTFVLTGMNYQTFVSKFRKAGRWTTSG